jgi:serine/threonine-protein kinase
LNNLSATRWNRIQGLLEESFELPEPERGDFLKAACRGDVELYAQVDTLLRAHDRAPAFLEGNALDFAGSLLPVELADNDPPLDCRDQHIGSYRLIAEIGRGGMGVVYRAERADGAFEHEVAIKLLAMSPGPGKLERFRQEQQVLASLNHPNIARLYDGGVTNDGRPYLVMEYVKGYPLLDYCDRRELGIEERLDFVCQIAAALQHAHGNLVIHRDIKPSNILVTEEGKTKLLDFGIAKWLDSAATSQLTRTGEQLLTPSFAAPEQLRQEPTTIATDVYQLGVVLYELLTGRRPFEQHGSFYKMARIVCEEMPIRPSATFSLRRSDCDPPGERLHRPSRQRSARLQKKLRGDLDAIVLRALRKEPERRYPSMEAFAADLRAYCEARPVAARHQTLRYQAGKFLQRHRFGIAAGFSLIALMVAYAITVTIQAHRVQNALDRTRAETHKAEQVSEFLVDLFKLSDPNVSGIETVTARELLEKGRQRVHTELRDVPETQAQMSYVLGEIYYNLGAYEESVSLLEGTLNTRRDLRSGEDPVLADTLIRLGVTYSSMDRYDEALGLFEEALSIYDLHDIETAEKGEALNAIGSVLRKQGDYTGARAYFEKAVELLDRVTDGRHYELAVALNNLAALQVNLGEFAAAERNMREAVTLQETILGPEHSYFSVSLNNLATILARMERFEEAEPLHRRALSIQEAVLGPEHPYVAYTLLSLGKLMHGNRKLEIAETFFRRALSIHEAAYGRQSVAVANVLSRLSEVLQDQQRYAEADAASSEALQTDLAVLSEDHPRVGRDYLSLALLAHATGDTALARVRYEKALEILPGSSLEASSAKLGYARLLLDLALPSEAQQHAQAALELRRSKFPVGHGMVAEAQSVLGAILLRIGDPDAAGRLLNSAYETLRERRAGQDPILAETVAALSTLSGATSPGVVSRQ